MEALLDRKVVIALAIAGGVLSAAASLMQMRGMVDERRARQLNYAGYAFMGASMVLFVLAGLTGARA